jgi:hypothetical protein
MAPYENVMANPMAVHQLGPNAANSPLALISHGTYSSHGDCDRARLGLMQEWRKHGSLSAQQFRQYGGPSLFFRCVAGSDPHLVKPPGGLPMFTVNTFSY